MEYFGPFWPIWTILGYFGKFFLTASLELYKITIKKTGLKSSNVHIYGPRKSPGEVKTKII